jgi:hypothetical protein
VEHGPVRRKPAFGQDAVKVRSGPSFKVQRKSP